MKRKLVLFFLFVILLSVSVCAAGAYHLDDLGMSLDIPAGYIVITRNMSPDDPALEQFAMDVAQIDQVMEENNLYLDLLNGDPAFEYIVTMMPNTVKDLDQFDEAALEELEKTMEEEYQSLGVTVKELDHETVGQNVFFRILGSTDETGYETQLLQYYTIHNFQAINLTLRYEGEELPAQEQQIAKDILESVRFDDETAESASEPFEYLDSETGVRFVVPSGWVEVLVDQSYFNADQQKAIRATFSCVEEPNLAIVYACADVMEEMPSLFKMFADRSMIDMEAVSLDDLTEALPYEVRSAETRNIAGRDFYVLEVNGTASVAGNDVEFTETDVIRIENGYEYTFQFGGTADNPRFQEFLTLVENAEFPKVEAPEAEAAPEASAETPALISPSPEADAVETPSPAPAEKKKGVPLLPILLGLAAIGVIVGLAARGKKKKQVQQAAYAVPVEPAAPAPAAPETPGAPEAPAESAPAAKRVCTACGAGLAEGESVCPYCGTKA